MFHQLCKRGPVGRTIQPAVQHGLVSAKKKEIRRIIGGFIYWRFQPPHTSFWLTSLWERILEASSWCLPSASCRKTRRCKRPGMEKPLRLEWQSRFRHSVVLVVVCWSVQDSPREKISHRRTPKDQTSLCVVYTRSKMVSGAIHLRGSRAWRQVVSLVNNCGNLGGKDYQVRCCRLTSPLRT